MRDHRLDPDVVKGAAIIIRRTRRGLGEIIASTSLMTAVQVGAAGLGWITVGRRYTTVLAFVATFGDTGGRTSRCPKARSRNSPPIRSSVVPSPGQITRHDRRDEAGHELRHVLRQEREARLVAIRPLENLDRCASTTPPAGRHAHRYVDRRAG